MKIGFFYRRLDQGGIQRVILNSAQFFSANGHDVSIILLKQEGEYLDIIDKNIKIIPFESTRKINLFSSFQKILKKEDFDIIFTASPPLNVFTILCKYLIRSKTKIVISEHNNTVALFTSRRLSMTRLSFFSIPLFYRFADCIVSVSKGISNNLASLALIPKNKINTIYNPAYTHQLISQMDENVTHPWLQDKKEPVIITVGRLSKAKNQRLLIRAFAKVLKHRKAKLIVVGEGELRGQLQLEIEKQGLEESVSLAGFQMNPVSWIAKSDIFVLSSDFEGFGVVLVEALATGITVVTTDCKYGPAEIVNNGEFGYLAAVGDEDDLCDKMLKALNTPLPKEHQVGRAKEFHVDSIMQQYDKLFSTLLTC